MARGKQLIGLDIGSSSIKVCQLKQVRSSYQLKHFAQMDLPQDTIVDGALMNASGVVDTIKELLGRNRIRIKDCAIGVSGFSVIVKRVSLPLMTEQELEQNLEWEVEHHIPDVNDVYIDKQILQENPHIRSMDVLLVAAKKEMVDEYLSVVRQAGLKPRVVDVDAFAVQNMFERSYHDLVEVENVALVHSGALTTTINVVNEGITAFTRDLPNAGDQFTEEIQKQLDVTRDEAETYKLARWEDEPDNTILNGIDDAMERVAESTASVIERSLNFHIESSGRRELDRIILTGGTAKVEALQRALVEMMDVQVEVGNPFAGIDYDPKVHTAEYLEETAPIAAVAVGLALRRTHER